MLVIQNKMPLYIKEHRINNNGTEFLPKVSQDTIYLKQDSFKENASLTSDNIEKSLGANLKKLKANDSESKDVSSKEKKGSTKVPGQIKDNNQIAQSNKNCSLDKKSGEDELQNPQPDKNQSFENGIPEAAKQPIGEEERKALEKEAQERDKQKAEEILTRMEAERELHLAKMEAIRANLQIEIQRIWEEVILRRRKVQDEMFKNWYKVFTG